MASFIASALAAPPSPRPPRVVTGYAMPACFTLRTVPAVSISYPPNRWSLRFPIKQFGDYRQYPYETATTRMFQ